jgi:lysozyme family protein
MSFEKAFPFIIQWEGSTYEDVPGDPGGPTKYGIDTQDDLADLPPGVTIKTLTLDEAKAIYLKKYWNGMGASLMPEPVDMVHFNYCVNTGYGRSIKFMQAVLGVEVDGNFGPITRAHMGIAQPLNLAEGMINQADAFYRHLATNGMSKFLNGWINRNAGLRALIKS